MFGNSLKSPTFKRITSEIVKRIQNIGSQNLDTCSYVPDQSADDVSNDHGKNGTKSDSYDV